MSVVNEEPTFSPSTIEENSSYHNVDIGFYQTAIFYVLATSLCILSVCAYFHYKKYQEDKELNLPSAGIAYVTANRDEFAFDFSRPIAISADQSIPIEDVDIEMMGRQSSIHGGNPFSLQTINNDNDNGRDNDNSSHRFTFYLPSEVIAVSTPSIELSNVEAVRVGSPVISPRSASSRNLTVVSAVLPRRGGSPVSPRRLAESIPAEAVPHRFQRVGWQR